jgi:hypothetical protein
MFELNFKPCIVFDSNDADWLFELLVLLIVNLDVILFTSKNDVIEGSELLLLLQEELNHSVALVVVVNRVLHW